MSRTALIIVVVLVVVLAVVAFLVVRRRRYIGALRGRGWTFNSRPQLVEVLDHQAPPFGLGFERSVDEGITGTTRSGIAFHVFEYACREGGPPFDQRLASLALPLALPDLYVSSGEPRHGVRFADLETGGQLGSGFAVRAGDAGYARTLLSAPVVAAVTAFGAAGHRVDLSIDGAHLVAVGAPKDPDALEAYLEALAPIVSALDLAALSAYAQPAAPPRFGFYGHPDWELVGSDDRLIDKYDLTTAGYAHVTEKLVRGDNDGLPLEAFIHRWKTQRTETSTDSEGKTTTRTVTEDHSEVVAAVGLPFELPLLSVNGPWNGKKVRFESEEFNKAFTVRTDEPKFASDVIHPRTMEYLMRVQPPGFVINGALLRFEVSEHDTVTIGICADFAHEFLSRVPSFVWRDRQLTPPQFRVGHE
jgi:hypothetical protein